MFNSFAAPHLGLVLLTRIPELPRVRQPLARGAALQRQLSRSGLGRGGSRSPPPGPCASPPRQPATLPPGLGPEPPPGPGAPASERPPCSRSPGLTRALVSLPAGRYLAPVLRFLPARPARCSGVQRVLPPARGRTGPPCALSFPLR